MLCLYRNMQSSHSTRPEPALTISFGPSYFCPSYFLIILIPPPIVYNKWCSGHASEYAISKEVAETTSREEKVENLASVFKGVGFKPKHASKGAWAEDGIEGRLVFHFKTKKKSLALIDFCANGFPLISHVGLGFHDKINRYIVTVHFWNKDIGRLAKKIGAIKSNATS